MSDLPRPKVMLDILEEHFEELDFLWEQRERVVFSPDWTLPRLAELERRAEAHLDGLRIGAGRSVDIARPFLTGQEKSAATAAAFVFLAMEHPGLDEEILSVFAQAADNARDGIRIALRHGPAERLASPLRALASAGDPQVRIAALDVLAFHRMPPPRFLDLLGVGGAAARRMLYDAIGRFGGPWNSDLLETGLAAPDSALRRSALEASARTGLYGLADICRRFAARTPPVLEALTFLGILGEPQDVPLLQAAAATPAAASAALAGIGALGRVEGIPFLLDRIAEPALVLAAGAAFSRITGATDVAADVRTPLPEDLPADEKDFWDPPRPLDPGLARAWWEKNRGRLAPDRRWQAGFDVSTPPLTASLDLLPLDVRRDVYLGARASDPVQVPDLELEARAAPRSPRK